MASFLSLEVKTCFCQCFDYLLTRKVSRVVCSFCNNLRLYSIFANFCWYRETIFKKGFDIGFDSFFDIACSFCFSLALGNTPF